VSKFNLRANLNLLARHMRVTWTGRHSHTVAHERGSRFPWKKVEKYWEITTFSPLPQAAPERHTLSAFQLPVQSNVISIPKQTDKRVICLYCAKLYVRQLEQDADPRSDQVHGGPSAEGGVLGGDR
jgi:hypothetical protein